MIIVRTELKGDFGFDTLSGAQNFVDTVNTSHKMAGGRYMPTMTISEYPDQEEYQNHEENEKA